MRQQIIAKAIAIELENSRERPAPRLDLVGLSHGDVEDVGTQPAAPTLASQTCRRLIQDAELWPGGPTRLQDLSHSAMPRAFAAKDAFLHNQRKLTTRVAVVLLDEGVNPSAVFHRRGDRALNTDHRDL